MKSGSWASYQAALPIEARACGEPDDREPDPPPVLGFFVSWLHDERCSDGEVHTVRSGRAFMGDSHGNAFLAGRAAMRWMTLMEKRYGKGNVWEEVVD